MKVKLYGVCKSFNIVLEVKKPLTISYCSLGYRISDQTLKIKHFICVYNFSYPGFSNSEIIT